MAGHAGAWPQSEVAGKSRITPIAFDQQKGLTVRRQELIGLPPRAVSKTTKVYAGGMILRHATRRRQRQTAAGTGAELYELVAIHCKPWRTLVVRCAWSAFRSPDLRSDIDRGVPGAIAAGRADS